VCKEVNLEAMARDHPCHAFELAEEILVKDKSISKPPKDRKAHHDNRP